jgi:hypothetical protein
MGDYTPAKVLKANPRVRPPRRAKESSHSADRTPAINRRKSATDNLPSASYGQGPRASVPGLEADVVNRVSAAAKPGEDDGRNSVE